MLRRGMTPTLPNIKFGTLDATGKCFPIHAAFAWRRDYGDAKLAGSGEIERLELCSCCKEEFEVGKFS